MPDPGARFEVRFFRLLLVVGWTGFGVRRETHLFVGLEDVAPEHIAGPVPGDVAEYLQILRVVGDIEYSEIRDKRKS